MIRIHFEEIAVKATKRWRDPSTGRPRSKTRRFWQTLSPFNRGADGQPKTADQIRTEITAERDAWLATGEQQCNRVKR